MCTIYPNYDRSFNDTSLRIQYRSYAFVEFRSQRDAEDAYYDMYVSGSCSVQLPPTVLTISSSYFVLLIGTEDTSKDRDLVSK